jgi:Resolvase, N terminal domain
MLRQQRRPGALKGSIQADRSPGLNATSIQLIRLSWRIGRPGFDALCKDATRRRFDIVMAWSVDRLGRSLQDLVAFLAEVHEAKVDLYLQQHGIDTTTPAGRALFQMCWHASSV